MKFLASFAAAVMLAVSPAAAQDCPYAGYDRYVFFGVRPAQVPPDLLVVKVNPVGVERTGRVKILEPADGLRGLSTIRVYSGSRTGCSQWGTLDQPAYMIGFLARDSVGEIYFYAIQAPLKAPALPRGAELDSYVVDPAYLSGAPMAREPK
ncbi:MAG: hypothetical protein JWL96_97 [Sphingomonas bacterium]|uniref:hypothetical protein n=1 Tax=Sphingomonas bacterium TaxID=1895847 RepID=UPI00262C09E7|nr:hypothetical protein [Sphingomonas bacterium]MDB5708027.1 hypothetical protein [Sphingomonas bacterium]